MTFLLTDSGNVVDVVWVLGVALLLALGAFAVHYLLLFVARRIARRTSTVQDTAFLRCVFHPLRWIIVAIALLWTDDIVTRGQNVAVVLAGVVRTLMPILWGWLAVAIIRFARSYVTAISDVDVVDNLAARRRRTRADILANIATVIVIVVSIGLMLLKIPEVREIGVALVASAGLAGLAVGIAAQPLLKNLVAGVQLAFTEPVRIDDVIVYRGEWGRVESISLTYVVLKIWDDRRLVIPVSKLVEEPIENWTRETSHLLGSVMIYTDHAADVERLRAAALDAIRGHRLWDGRAAAVQVTDMTADALEVRVLMSGKNGGELFEMRCDVREAVMQFLATNMPAALNRTRMALRPLSAE